MSKDGGTELDAPPQFCVGDKVRTRCPIRNDGSFLGRRIGEELIGAGQTGYVRGIGTFLQRFVIYEVDFLEPGLVIGMRAKELECLEVETP